MNPNPAETLTTLAEKLSSQRVEKAFTNDRNRAERFCCEGAGIQLDYSKHRIDEAVLASLRALSDAKQLATQFDQLTAGAPLNLTEARPALHTLLRGFRSEELPALHREVVDAQTKMRKLVDAVLTGRRRGYTGETFTDVVNIGIGGSDFGPRMICRALDTADPGLAAHFAANVDPQDLAETLAGLDPARTLFIVCSKSFSTEETLTNALSAREWLLVAGARSEDIAQHMVAVTTNIPAAEAFGIAASECYPLWDWVGGRYSVWSAIGLAVALQCGWDAFQALLHGAYEMDCHTHNAAGAANLPLMLALLEYWNTQYLLTETHAVLPYSQRLTLLPDFLQQLSMESNGKRVNTQGEPVSQMTAPVLWGSAGTIGQHSYFQLLHQGTRPFTADIILPLTNGDVDIDGHRKLAANALAQSRALLTGRNPDEAASLALGRQQPASFAPHYEMPGNHAHSLVTFRAVTPHSLGALIAAYEHKTFFLAQLLGINPFDQWGVELGKVIGKQMLTALETGAGLEAFDSSTAAIARAWRAANQRED